MLAVAAAELTRTPGAVVSMAGPHVCAPIDANGNLTSDGQSTNSWTARNQLKAISQDAVEVGFEYDGLGRRVRTLENDNGLPVSETIDLWSAFSALETRGATGTVSNRRFSGAHQLGTDVFYVAEDHLGSMRDAVSVSNVRAAHDEYDPVGRLTRLQSTSLPAKFGEASVSPLGRIDAVFRSYTPSTGAWWSEDPTGFADGPNLYTFVRNAPVARIDPLGEQSWTNWVGRINPCVGRILADANSISGLGNSRRAHCVTTCRLSRECGGNPGQAQALGFLKEISDAAMCVIGGVKRVCQSAFQRTDLEDNTVGTLCVLMPEDCTSFCNRVVPPGNGPNGPMTFMGRR